MRTEQQARAIRVAAWEIAHARAADLAMYENEAWHEFVSEFQSVLGSEQGLSWDDAHSDSLIFAHAVEMLDDAQGMADTIRAEEAAS